MFELLQTVGYGIVEDALVDPDGKVVAAHKLDRMERLEGKLANVNYMAHAMDRLDKVPTFAPENPEGTNQLRHLLEKWPATAYAYFIMRRHQRDGQTAQLRLDMAIMYAADLGLVSNSDLMRHFSPWLDNSDDQTTIIEMYRERFAALSERATA